MSQPLMCSDLHMDRTIDTHFAFQQIVDHAVRTRAMFVVIAGDISDKQTQRSEPVAALFRGFDKLRDAEIPVYYLQGQHDYDTPPWPAGHAWPTHLHKLHLDIDGETQMYGLDFQPFGKLQDELAEVPRGGNLLIAHQGWEEWLGFDNAPQGSFAQVPGHVEMLYTGDLHKLVNERNKNADGVKMLTVSSGATTQRKADETDEHWFMAFDPKRKVFVRQPLKSRIFIDWSLMTQPAHVDRFMDTFAAELAVAQQKAAAGDYPDGMLKPRLRVTYSASLEDVVRRVTKLVGNQVEFLHFKEIPPEERREAMRLSKAEKGVAVTPLSVLGDEIDKDEDPEAYELAQRLLTTTNIEEEFARWRSENMSTGSSSGDAKTTGEDVLDDT